MNTNKDTKINKNIQNSTNNIQSFTAGAFSGLCQIIIGYPLDTLKVRIQSKKPIFGLSIRDYYRGIGFPIVSGIIVNSIVFGTYKNFKEYTGENIISGFMAGATISPFVYVFDIGKTKQQISKHPKLNMILHNKGFPASIMRESLAFSMYFSTYEYLHKTHKQNILVSGALAGLANWTFTYPLDVIRNRQIALNISAKQAFQMGNLFTGYMPCAVRALIVNAVGFYMYEYALEKTRTFIC